MPVQNQVVWPQTLPEFTQLKLGPSALKKVPAWDALQGGVSLFLTAHPQLMQESRDKGLTETELRALVTCPASKQHVAVMLVVLNMS